MVASCKLPLGIPSLSLFGAEAMLIAIVQNCKFAQDRKYGPNSQPTLRSARQSGRNTSDNLRGKLPDQPARLSPISRRHRNPPVVREPLKGVRWIRPSSTVYRASG